MAASKGCSAFAGFLTVLGDAFATAFVEGLRGAAVERPEADFAADFFDDFEAMRLPFVAFRRSKG
jgi:hypothetical protein